MKIPDTISDLICKLFVGYTTLGRNYILKHRQRRFLLDNW